MSDCSDVYEAMRKHKARMKYIKAEANRKIVSESGVKHYFQWNGTIVFPVKDGKVMLYPATDRVQYRDSVWNGGAKKALEVVASISGGGSCLK